jgi:phosphoribosylformimino-5-aminoimidazole carboxamide ribonucleotide (ProFAR) isomerase
MIKDIIHYLTSTDEGATRGAITAEAETDVEGVVVAINTRGDSGTIDTINNGRGSTRSARSRSNILDTTEGRAINNLLTTHILEEGSGEGISDSNCRGSKAEVGDHTETVRCSGCVEECRDVSTCRKGRDGTVVRIVKGDLL